MALLPRMIGAIVGCALASGAIAQTTTTSAAPAEVIRPDWIPQTTVTRVYPERALLQGKSGKATLRCLVSESFGVTACKVISQEPGGFGFGAAALELAKFFRMKPITLDGVPVLPGMAVMVTVPFKLE